MKRITQEYQHYLYWKDKREKAWFPVMAKKITLTTSFLLLILVAQDVFLSSLTLEAFLFYVLLCSMIGIWDGYRSWNHNEKRHQRNLKWHQKEV